MTQYEPGSAFRPRVCVWELTLSCNCRCVHCGSNAGRARSRELTSHEAVHLVADLAELGCSCITLSGGEPLLRQDWFQIAGAVHAHGMQVELITNGLLVYERADSIAHAGFASVTFSIDGPAAIHDRLRGVHGSLDHIWRGAAALQCRGIKVGAVTQINRHNRGHLKEIQQLLLQHEFGGWQLQLTMPHGRARDDGSGLCLKSSDLPRLETELLELRACPDLPIQIGDNIGYMSRNEPLLRSAPADARRCWTGCSAGLTVIGITSDGDVRGCLSQPSWMNEGNVRERPLADIWNDPRAFAYNRQFVPTRLRGPCAGCAFGEICRGGCRSLAAAFSPEEPFANPYCLFALQADPMEAR